MIVNVMRIILKKNLSVLNAVYIVENVLIQSILVLIVMLIRIENYRIIIVYVCLIFMRSMDNVKNAPKFVKIV